tara:strand:- start:1052 stop:2572 length:1521 start_codon:yes stop_codon:yes gene_type:complete
MDVSLGALRQRLLEFRAWDSSGATFDKRVRESLNFALDRLSGDVPEALIPDEEHVVLRKDFVSADTKVYLNAGSDTRVLAIENTAGDSFGAVSSSEDGYTFFNTDMQTDGTWDGIMHLEIKDPDGKWHRRQTREWFTTGSGSGKVAFVSLDRPWRNASDATMEFRIHQPEFFVRDDVMRILEPMRIYDATRQQIWAIDTAGASRQDMVDYQGESKGRPYRFWRGRHYQVQPPRQPAGIAYGGQHGMWVGPWQQGKFRFCYTYVWGKKHKEWQESPMGTLDPIWESAPSPISPVADHNANPAQEILVQMTNIDAMTNFDVTGTIRETHSGLKLRIYVARDEVKTFGGTANAYNNVERAGIFYFLTEVDPAAVSPTASYTWNGSVLPDYYRPLKHSTGYFAYKVYPHQDAQYELDMRVLRLPRKFIDDQDTAPIQRDAIPALVELALYYLCLQDGVDQEGAQLHLNRYQQLAKKYRLNYANPGRIVEPVPLGGHPGRSRYGVFSTSDT